jgi:hypothetical protein
VKDERLFIYGDREYGANKTSPNYRCAGCKQHIADDERPMHAILDHKAHQEQ